MLENSIQNYSYNACNYDCWECPALPNCEDAKGIVETIIPHELRKFGARLDELIILRKADNRLTELLRLKKIECRIEHLIKLKEVDCSLDVMLKRRQSSIKDKIDKIKSIFNKIEKEFKKW